MTARVAINGFGRIGRNVLRAALARNASFDVVAINDLGDPAQLRQLLRYDSSLGRYPGTVEVDGNHLIVDGKRIALTAGREPSELPWREHGVDVVLESTGQFTTDGSSRGHLDAGAAKVLISAPSPDADVTIAYGINDAAYDAERHSIISNASCTTNGLAPLASVLDDVAGIEGGFMTTVHAYTQEQNLQDGPHRDFRRARAAALNIAPTSTGAAKAIGLVLPGLSGKIDGYAVRVPVAVGSLVELNVTTTREVDREQINAAYEKAARESLRGILEYSADPLVSTDVTGNPASTIFDSELTMTKAKNVKVVGWYDNEWGFSNRVVDSLQLLAG